MQTDSKTKSAKYQLASLHANYQYRFEQLQSEIEDTLRTLISKSNWQHPDYDRPAIKVNVFGYTALTIINDKLIFLDGNGYQYSLDAESQITDLLDIIKSLSEN